DFITIGPHFVHSLDRAPSGGDTVAATIALAQKLGIKTIAKGVETAAQYAALKSWGCDLAQGSFISGTLEPWVMREKLRSERGHLKMYARITLTSQPIHHDTYSSDSEIHNFQASAEVGERTSLY